MGITLGMTSKIAISMDRKLLGQVDRLVRGKRFKSRSQLIQAAVAEKIGDLNESALARECAKLDPQEEKNWAELGLAEDAKSWPEY
jgi:Arc/MetJ-type ribon-helix-helix transcriptional regulator